jgi:hypothetical protein
MPERLPGPLMPYRGGARAVLAALTGLVLLVGLVLSAGCGGAHRSSDTSGIPAELLREARPIGAGPRFRPPVRGPVTGRCRPRLGPRRGVHVELFAANRVVIVARGIGTKPPRQFSGGRISRARCYGDLVTLEPTGVVLVRPGRRQRLEHLFRAWGQPLSRRRLASFTAPDGTEVAVFVGGRRWRGPPGGVPLAPHSEIVLEVGPYVPPHKSYTFPPGT